MSKKSNSIERLLAILSKAKEQKHAGSIKGRDFLAENFPSFSQRTSPERVYAEIIALASNVRDEITALNMNTDAVVTNIDEVLEALGGYSLTNPIGVLNNAVKPTSISGLKAFACVLDEKVPEKSLAESELEELRQGVQDLMAEVIESDIDAKLKEFILDKLNNIEQAINMHEFHGTVAIVKSLHEAIGGIGVAEWTGVKDRNVELEIWEKVKRFVCKTLIVVAALNTTETAIENACELKNFLIEACESNVDQDVSLSENTINNESRSRDLKRA